MFLRVYLGGDFFMAKKGQTYKTYTEELKLEVVRLKLEEGGLTVSSVNVLELKVMLKLPNG